MLHDGCTVCDGGMESKERKLHDLADSKSDSIKEITARRDGLNTKEID